jgi:carbon monoxide dehydrogenase subunit G
VASSVSSSVIINRPIEDVFAVLTNVENAGKWFPTQVEEWWTSPPPHGVGSTRRARIKVGPVTTENDAVATVYEPPNRATMKGMSSNAPFEADLRFTAVEGGTRVDTQIGLFMTGGAKLFEGMFIRWYGKSWHQGMANLKRMMEAGDL